MGRHANGGLTLETLGDLIDEGYALNVWCGNRPDCGRKLDCDIYDLAIWLGRRQRFVRVGLPLRCQACGSKEVATTIQPDTRSRESAMRGQPENFRSGRTEAERTALAAVFPRRS